MAINPLIPMKTKIHFPSGSSLITSAIPIQGNFTPHFKFAELYNPSSDEDINMEIYPWSWDFMTMAEEFRNKRVDRIGGYCAVNSGYRTPKFNASLPDSVSWSGHTKMLCLDIAGALTDTEMKKELADWKALCDKYNTIGEFIVHQNYLHIGAFVEHFDNPYTNTFYFNDRR